MRNPFKRGTPAAFFFREAGYSYAPDETPEQGRARCAKHLADAERRGSDEGLSFEWEQDTITSAEFSDEEPVYALWACCCRARRRVSVRDRLRPRWRALGAGLPSRSRGGTCVGSVLLPHPARPGRGCVVSGRAVRFWIFENLGYVRLTLRPGQTLAWSSGGSTDEGWSARCVSWTHDGDVIRCNVDESGRDCDGASSWGADLVCPVDRLRAFRPPVDDAPAEGCPDWQEDRTFQRDYAAEAAGY